MFTIFLCVKVLICLLSPGGPVLNLGANQLACHRRLILPLVLKCRLSLRRSHDGEVITSKILMSHWLMHQSVNIHIVSWANLRPVCIKEAPNLVACVNRGHFVVSCEEVWAGGKWFHCGWFVLFCWKSHLLQYKTTVNPSCGSVDVGSSQYMWMLSSTAHTHTYGRSLKKSCVCAPFNPLSECSGGNWRLCCSVFAPLYMLKWILWGFLFPTWRTPINESNLEHSKQASSSRTNNHIDRIENTSEIQLWPCWICCLSVSTQQGAHVKG